MTNQPPIAIIQTALLAIIAIMQLMPLIDPPVYAFAIETVRGSITMLEVPTMDVCKSLRMDAMEGVFILCYDGQ